MTKNLDYFVEFEKFSEFNGKVGFDNAVFLSGKTFGFVEQKSCTECGCTRQAHACGMPNGCKCFSGKSGLNHLK